MKKLPLIFGMTAIMLAAWALGFMTRQHFQTESVDEVAIGSEVQEKRSEKTFTAKTIIGEKRLDFGLMDLDGEERHISEWDGKILAINFWATWCPPCRDEIPEFIHLQNEFGEAGLQFLGIALQTAEEVRPFYDEVGINYPTLVGEQEVIRIAKAFGNDLGALPYTVFIRPTGEVHFVKRGPLSSEEAREIIKTLL